MKTILVATDYSSPANNAVEYAAHIAQKSGAELILFNVFKLSPHASNALASTSSIENLIQKNEYHLSELSKDLMARYQIKVRGEWKKDDTIESLKSFTASNPVDLVVMGIESNLTEYKLFGNTTTAAIKLRQFPLLVVPNDTHFEGMGKIKYACDSSYLTQDCKLALLKEFVQTFGSELEVFHVLTSGRDQDRNEEMEILMDNLLQGIDHSYQYHHSPKVGDGIKAGLEEFPADLLVMIPHKLTFFESVFNRSNTNQMTVKTRVPLLVIPSELAC